MLIKIMAIFLLSLSIGVLYRVPKSSLMYGGIIGIIGWLNFSIIYARGGNIVLGCFVGSFMVALFSEIFARRLRKPATVFLIPGFIPLVPGREAYLTMSSMVRGDYLEGIAMATQTAWMGGAIAMGIFVIATLVHTISAWQKRGEFGDVS
jgi:uncharacterized membrane protein YjjB (DUF3815 family)